LADGFSVRGQDATRGYIAFGNADNTALGRSGSGPLTYGGNTIWHAGNDGGGSGLTRICSTVFRPMPSRASPPSRLAAPAISS
jgi:hypothetical protein